MHRLIVSCRANAYAATLLIAIATALVLSAAGWADANAARARAAGVKPAGGHAVGLIASSITSGLVHSGDVTVTANGDGVTLATRTSAFLWKEMRIVGSVSPAAAGEIVEIERLGRETGWAWAPTAHSAVRGGGSFAVVWRANHIGRFAIRAVLEQAVGAHPDAASPTVTVTVYRQSIATQYGSGFYGRATACGEVLTPATLGIAHRTLKCGTPVAIYYRGRTIVVPVIDRGPYANHADWDLTEATGRALGIPGTATIEAVSLLPRGR